MGEVQAQDPLAKVETERRDFLKKIAVAAAFAAPTIATFSVDGMRKKAFAQAAYDQPHVVSFEASVDSAFVTFSEAMDTAVGTDVSRIADPSCRTTSFSIGGVSYNWSWNGSNQQMITFGGCPGGPADLTVTYNQGGCGPKFVSADGLRELKPFSGTIQVSVTCPE